MLILLFALCSLSSFSLFLVFVLPFCCFSIISPSLVLSPFLSLYLFTFAHISLYLAVRRYTCRTYPVDDVKGPAQPAPWSFQRFLAKWVTLSSIVCLNDKVCVAKHGKASCLVRDVMKGLQPLLDALHQHTVVTFQGHSGVPSPSDPLVCMGKKATSPDFPCLECKVYLGQNLVVPDQSNFSTLRLHVQGRMAIRALVPPRATVAEALMVSSVLVLTETPKCMKEKEQTVQKNCRDEVLGVARLSHEHPTRKRTHTPNKQRGREGACDRGRGDEQNPCCLTG